MGASKFQTGKRNLLEKLYCLGQLLECIQFKKKDLKIKLNEQIVMDDAVENDNVTNASMDKN